MTRTRGTRRMPRRIVMTLTALAVVMAATLGPQAFVGPLRHDAFRSVDAVIAPLSLWVPWSDLERIMNVVLFIPVGAGLAALLGHGVGRSIVAGSTGVAVSIAVELAQESLPGRVPDVEDIVWNGLGAVLGVAAVVALRVLRNTVALVRARGRRRSTYVPSAHTTSAGHAAPGSLTSTVSPPSGRATRSSVPW